MKLNDLVVWLDGLRRKPGLNLVSPRVLPAHFKAGDRVRVRSREDILATLNHWHELKGCGFMEEMSEYCGTERRIFKVVERFLDERDYRLKKTRGVVILEGAICHGTGAYGRCDRSCFFFWREEWLEKVEEAAP